MTTEFTGAGAMPRHADGPIAALAGKWLFKLLSGIRAGSLMLTLPSGERRTVSGPTQGPAADIHIHSWRAVRRIVTGGDIGFAEGYIDGDWTSSDVAVLLELIARNDEAIEFRVEGTPLRRLADRVYHRLRANTRKGSRRNIQAHYDLGNAFYKEWLDPTMTYSAAIYDRPNDPLEHAQLRKYRRMAEMIGAAPGQHVLEIGCGWGGFSTYLAERHGCRVTGITLSDEQHDYARDLVARKGLSDRVDIRIEDYRDVHGKFDGIASIEMFEAVGESNWPQFFSKVRQRLADQGRAALQVITIDEKRFETYRRKPDFIQRYVFPGGMLPSVEAFRAHAVQAGLDLRDSFFFGQCYARTLAEWQHRFTETWPNIRSAGFDERFRRLWEYYLAYCRAGFRSGAIDVGQFVLQKI
ncbi:MAG: class I SAM-dependent methyltransferase [Rhodospirillales bacterium]